MPRQEQLCVTTRLASYRRAQCARQLAHGLGLLLLVASAQAASNAGDAARGKAAIERRGCVSCHIIPGIPNPGSNIGPTLDQIAKRSYIAGVLPNTRANMERWLRDPPAVVPRTAMPNLGIGEAEAKDIAAYLHTLD